ncbi:fimbrial protein [Jeongeupia chitinilytica]|uniref:Fimbrial protein n=1 Tax=Jeongeupia chitinilytica TaxID=1041641 RepID=A0ABQ3H4F2_9NEIS|nr:fimbrial protein [Jeongeupia chitinilytica]GHD69943.1 fimbrial protein [Jeongeupia chitinilytica]
MKFSTISAMFAAALGFAAIGAHASDGTITINGELTAQTCTISGNGQGNNFTVTLPKVATSVLAAAGSTAGATGFNIALTNCTPATGNVRTFFEYGSNTLADGNLKNATGTATLVEVQLLNGDMSPIDMSKADGAQNSKIVAINSGAANLPYAAQYNSPAGGATAGTVSTTTTYSLSYQ